MPEDTDEELVQSTRAGCQQAFTRLVRRHQNYAYGTAIGLLSDFELARDVVQEAFLTAYRDLSRLRDPARFGLWLRGIVRHTALTALREREKIRDMARELAYLAEDHVPSKQDLDDAESLRKRSVRLALEALVPNQREVVGLYYLGGMPYAKIATLLNISETAVQGRLQRARAQLREELKMVEERFEQEGLPEDFSAEVERLLGAPQRDVDQAIAELTALGTDAVDPLCAALEDQRDSARRTAALALCAIGDERALYPLLRLVYSQRMWIFTQPRPARQAGDWRPDWSPMGRLLDVPGLREKLLERVRNNQATWCELLILSYAEGDDAVYSAIRDLLRRSGNWQQSENALQALGRIRPDDAPRLLQQHLSSADRRHRYAACQAAFYLYITPSLDACIKALALGIDDRSLTFLLLLLRDHGQEGQQALENMLDHESETARFTAAIALAPTRSRKAFDVLMQTFATPEPYVQRFWQKWRPLGENYAPELAAWIEENDIGPSGPYVVVQALARNTHADYAIGPVLEGLTDHAAESVCAAAINIMARRRGADYLPELRQRLATGRSAIARSAFRAVERLGQEAVPMAEDMLSTQNWKERKAAVCLLRRWGILTDEQRATAEADEHVAVRRAVVPYIKRQRGI